MSDRKAISKTKLYNRVKISVNRKYGVSYPVSEYRKAIKALEMIDNQVDNPTDDDVLTVEAWLQTNGKPMIKNAAPLAIREETGITKTESEETGITTSQPTNLQPITSADNSQAVGLDQYNQDLIIANQQARNEVQEMISQALSVKNQLQAQEVENLQGLIADFDRYSQEQNLEKLKLLASQLAVILKKNELLFAQGVSEIFGNAVNDMKNSLNEAKKNPYTLF